MKWRNKGRRQREEIEKEKEEVRKRLQESAEVAQIYHLELSSSLPSLPSPSTQDFGLNHPLSPPSPSFSGGLMTDR